MLVVGAKDGYVGRDGRAGRSVEARLEADGCAAELAEAPAVERQADHRGERGREAAGRGREDRRGGGGGAAVAGHRQCAERAAPW